MVVKQKNRQRFILTFVAVCFGLVGSNVMAQSSKKATPASSTAVAETNSQTKSQSDKPVKFSARFHIEKGKTKGFLIVRAEVKKGSYIYGMNQKKPLNPSLLAATKMTEIKSFGKFKADKPPKVTENDPLFNARVEKHYGTVQFFAPVELADGVDPSKLSPVIEFSGQACSDEGYCVQIEKEKIAAKFAGFFERQAKGLPGNTKR